jgi:outer membrane receptor protein involved in Fe transport
VFVACAVAIAAPVHAQEVQTEEETPGQSETETESGTNAQAEGDESGTITVTGSRIRRPNLESAVPVTSVGGEEFFQTGQVSVGDVLNELPALRSTFSQANSTRFLGTGGLNLLDLRGLGTQRTLVLQNGRRHIGSNVLGNAVEVDVNTIPTDLIERVDVVTGGNSAIYGSDAIAGVVNFILKRDFQGVQLRGQAGISSYGDAGSYYGSLLAGQNFADGRGNIAINLEYARQNPFFAVGRPNLRSNDNFLQVDTDPSGTTNGSDGIPDRVFFRDIRNPTSPTGSVLFNTGACGKDPLGTNYQCLFQFDAAGNLAPVTSARAGLAPLGSFIGGNAFNPRANGQQFGIYPETDRYAANMMGHFTISEAFEPFFEAKYVRTDSNGLSNAGPAFNTGFTIEGDRDRPRLDNPFLTPQNRAIIEAQLRAAGGNPTNATRFSLRRAFTDLGNRNESSRRETYRVVGGVRGDLSPVWNYEISANYGRLDEKTIIEGNLNIQRFVLAADAARDPATGQIVCRSKFDPAARNAYPFATDAAEAERRLADDIAKCLPYNQFGSNNSAAVRDYLVQDTLATGRLSQLVVNGFVSGDTSAWFNLPGGPIGVALGAEYRREKAFYDQDPLVAAGLTFYNAIPALDPPNAFEVKEVFGEVRLPILANTPFFHELTVTAAGRASDYNGKTGTVYAYNAGVEWSPVRDLRFRANYSRAVRAPNLADLYTAQGQNFALPFSDPCAANFLGTGSPNRAANCAAAGRPANFNFLYTESLLFTSGGNPDLNEETSDSLTVGGVFTPRFLPGFSLSVDYYDIKVNDVITSPSAQQIVNACYDLPDLNNQFCSLFQRAGAGGGPQNEERFRILEGSLQAVLLNYAALKTRGIDVEAAYRRNIEGVGNLNARINYTHVLQNDEFLDPTNPEFANQLLKELNFEQDALNLNLDLKTGPYTFGYQMRYIGKMVVNQYEDFFSKQGRPPQDADYADRMFYPSVLYHDARIGIEAGKDFEFYVGVDNFTNRLPPLGLTGVGGGSGVYNTLGRFFYAGAVAKF